MSPRDLPSHPAWPRLKGQRVVAVLEALAVVDPDAAADLADEVRSQIGLAPTSSQELLHRFLGLRTLGELIEGWQPQRRSRRIDDEALGAALEALLPQRPGLGEGRAAAGSSAAASGGSGASGSASGSGAAREAALKADVAVLGRRVARFQKEIYDLGSTYGPGLPTWGSALTVGHWLTLRDASLRGAQRWAQSMLETLDRRELADEGLRAQRRATWEAAAGSPEVRAVLELRDSLAKSDVLVPDAQIRTGVDAAWQPQEARFVVTRRGLLACLAHEACDEASIELTDPQAPVAQCRFAARRPCTLKLLASETLLDLMMPAAAENPLREYMARPPWRRLLDRLEAVARTKDLSLRPSEPEATLGWVVSPPDEAELCWVRPRKRQEGLTTQKLGMQKHELEVLLEDPRDRVAWMIARSDKTGSGEARVGPTLAALVGHPRVFLRHEGELVPVEVASGDPAVGVEPAADGSARLVVKFGGATLAQARRPNAGDWAVAYDGDARRVVVGRWTRAAVALWEAWDKAPVPVPLEAREALAATMVGLSKDAPVAFEASWLGDALPPEDKTVVRLGFAGSKGHKALTIEVCVQPVPELGPVTPAAGAEVVPVRRDGRLGHVVRDFDVEEAAVLRVADDLELPHGPTMWRLDSLEAALEAVQRLEKVQAELLWQSKPPRIARGARADKLSLRVGLKKDWLGLSGGLRVDGGELPLAELLEALRDKKRFVALDDERFIELDEVLRQSLAPLALIARRGAQGLGASPLAGAMLAELEAVGAAIDAPAEWLEQRQRMDDAARWEPPLPAGLVADLRPYQRDGFVWAARLAAWARGACLADDMGLGKTLQALALILHRQPLGRTLVVAPTSVVPNWLREAKRFAPGLAPVVVGGQGSVGLMKGASVVLTTYDVLVRNEPAFAEEPWATLVLDEAHAIKNAATKRAQTVKSLDVQFCLALTGTPVENRPSELWSLFQAVAPGLLGSAESFRQEYARPIEAEKSADAARRLARLVRPFVLRRAKSEVEKDLPPRVDVRVDVVLGPRRARALRARPALGAVGAGEARGGEGAVGGGRGIVKILAVLMRLRQLACHPRLVDPEAPLASAKLDQLLLLLEELRAEKRRALVFSQFTELLALVRGALDDAGITYAYLDGSTPAEKRIGEVDRFQAGTVDCFLLSLKAGGVGLNLTTASEVVLLDPWWNPAVEDQAADRAHRIGQDKAVTIYRLVASQTIEEQILALHADKRAMVSSLLEGTASSKALTADELMSLLAEEPDAA
ncbi:MAG: DEAD/DEAH box helicase [Myxococcota bacterium]